MIEADRAQLFKAWNAPANLAEMAGKLVVSAHISFAASWLELVLSLE